MFLFQNDVLFCSFQEVYRYISMHAQLPRLTLHDLMDCSPPRSSVHGLFQIRILQWVAIYYSIYQYQFSSIQSLSHVQLFVTSWTAADRASLSITNSQSLLKLMSIESVMPSDHLIVCCPFSCLQSFPASGSFPMSQFFPSGGQSIGVSVSASVLQMNIQD